MKSSRGFISLGLILAIVIGLAVLGGAGWWLSKNSLSLQSVGNDTTLLAIDVASTTTQETFEYPPDLRLIYTTVDSETVSDERHWPTNSIWIKRGDAVPELLTKVGKVGEYPYTFKLSPDRTYVAINLENKVQLLNVRTKELRTVLTPANGVAGIAFSPDSSKLWVAEGYTYVNSSNEDFVIHSITVASGFDTIKAKGTFRLIHGDFGLTQARSDGILFYRPLIYKGGHFFDKWGFDTNANKTITVHREYGLSEDGKAGLSDDVESVPNNCDGMSSPSTLPTIVHVVEPISGKVLGTIGRHDETFQLVAFSPDNTQVLYHTYADHKKKCVMKQGAFYLQTIAQGGSFAYQLSCLLCTL